MRLYLRHLSFGNSSHLDLCLQGLILGVSSGFSFTLKHGNNVTTFKIHKWSLSPALITLPRTLPRCPFKRCRGQACPSGGSRCAEEGCCSYPQSSTMANMSGVIAPEHLPAQPDPGSGEGTNAFIERGVSW